VRNGKQPIECFRKELDMERDKISKRKRRADLARRFLTGVALLGLSGVALVGLSGVTVIGCTGEGDEGVSGSVQPKAIGCDLAAPELCDDGVGLQLTLEGCRISDAPDGFDLEANNFRCDGAIPDIYVTGNIRPGFNELDLVPHRLTIGTTGAFEPDPQMYIVSIGHDSILSKPAGQFQGYDAITVPTLRPTDGCEIVEVGPERVEDVGVGGVDQTIFRDLVITQEAGAECVLDWQARLAVSRDPFLGASAFTGSSLQSQVVTGSGSKTVPIPVAAILPQEIDKAMTATQDTDFAWNITKGPMPAKLDFGDTCDPGNDLEEEVSIRVDWEILPGMPGMVMIVTNISATNPANRSIRVDVSDEIFSGATSLDVLDCDAVDVPANTTQLVCTHVIDAPADVTDLSDTATATYIDVVTGIPVPGQSQAMASAPIQPGTDTNTTAIITDTESISGNGLEYALNFVKSVLPPGQCTVGGSPYVPDSSTGIGPPLGPEDFDLICVTDPAVEVSGSATAFKIVTLDEPRITTGTLSDTADLTASDGFTASASASVMISSNATVALTINKTIPDVLDDGESCTFSFTVNGPDGFEETTSIDFGPGEFSKSTTVSGGPPGSYTVTEGPAGGDCEGKLIPEGGNVRDTDIVLPSCDGSVSFNNIPGAGLATAEAKKVTLPAGSEAGWDFTLDGPGGPITVTTTGAGFEPFGLALQEGDYTITEVEQDGWDKTMVSAGCEFTVNYPEDYGMTFQCTIENTQRGKIIINKVTDPAGGTGFGFTDNIEAPYAFTLDDGGTKTFLDVPADTYTVTEDDPTPEFDLVNLVCVDDFDQNGYNVVGSSTHLGNGTATINLDPGETVKCTYTNRQRGMVDLLKLTNGQQDPNMMWSFTLTGPEVNEGLSTPPPLLEFQSKLIPGETYTLCETGIPPSWTIQWALDANGNGMIDDGETLPFVGGEDDLMGDGLLQVYDPDPNYGTPSAMNDTRCVNFEVDAAQTLSFIVDNQRPGGEPRTPGYWKNWNTCTGGNQQETAAANGGPIEGWFLADDLIPTTVGDLNITTCEDAVSILDHRDLNSGKKKANCADFNLARNLLAAKLNLAAGAETCTAVADAVAAGDDLLSSLGFTGTNSCLRPKGQNKDAYHDANELAATLDEYNNGFLCN